MELLQNEVKVVVEHVVSNGCICSLELAASVAWSEDLIFELRPFNIVTRPTNWHQMEPSRACQTLPHHCCSHQLLEILLILDFMVTHVPMDYHQNHHRH